MKNSFKKIEYVIILALFARFVFLFFGAKIYYGTENFYVGGDTFAWANMFESLWKTGNYTINPNDPDGWFFRLPTYSYFLGFFWIFIQDWLTAFKVIAVVQILIDASCVWLIYKTCRNIGANNLTALIASLFYAIYPFAIVWTTMMYAETLTNFLLFFGVYLFTSKKYAFSGIMMALAMLCRPQAFMLVPFLPFIFTGTSIRKWFSKPVIVYGISCLIIFSLWPIRNYFLHDKLVITYEVGGSANWTKDVTNFRWYIYSVKSEWEPQFTEIIKNKEVTIPEEAKQFPEDLPKLEHAFALAKTCAPGFSHWKGYYAQRIQNKGCLDTVATLFNELRLEQIKKNPFNFYIRVPFQNLKKALFKIDLYNTSGFKLWLGRVLFGFRSILIVLGMLASVYLFVKFEKYRGIVLATLFFFWSFYLFMCFGTSSNSRNIEVRFFLPTDVLMLIPLGLGLGEFFNTSKNEKGIQQAI